MKPILIAGPTASGKSAIALEIAARIPAVILNADALQVYSGWRVLTARPDAEEEAKAPHRLYGHVRMDVSYSVGAWLRDIRPELERAFGDKLTPIIVGGTGLYLSALTEGLSDIPETPAALREQANEIMQTKGADWFREQLSLLDPETYEKLDQNNPVRLQRAWEVLEATGKGLAEWHRAKSEPLIDRDAAGLTLIEWETETLNRRIDTRFERMLEYGALEECERVVAADEWHTDLPSARAIGAAELIDHLRGRISLDEAREKSIIASRQYAKRQRTWFRNRMRAWARYGMEDGSERQVADNILNAHQQIANQATDSKE